jgi:hypothetical protein
LVNNVLGRANIDNVNCIGMGMMNEGAEQILLCLRHIGLRPDRAGFLRT